MKVVDDYIDEFSELVDEAGYTDGLSIVMKFQKVLDKVIQDRIVEMVQGRPNDDDLEGWYSAVHTPLMLIRQQTRPSMVRSVNWDLFQQSNRPIRHQGLCFQLSQPLQHPLTVCHNIQEYQLEHPTSLHPWRLMQHVIGILF